MIVNPRDKVLCDKYKRVGCYKCPLKQKGTPQCKANSHYNYKTKQWVYD